MIRKLFVVLGTVGIFALGIAVISVLGSMRPQVKKSEPVVQAPTLFVEEAAPETVNLSVIAQGEVKPQTEIGLTAQVSGKIVRVSENFNDGGVIRKGEKLVQIEDADYRVALARAEANLAQAEQALKVAEVEADLARQDAEEIGALDGGTLSPLALRQPQLEQARASFDAAKADVANANLNLTRTTVRAPFDGRIRKKNADIGQFIGPSSQLAQIFSTDVALIRVPLSDEDFSRLSLPLAYTADTSPLQAPAVILSANVGSRELSWRGKVVRTDASIDPATRQIAVIVEVKDPYGAAADDGFPLAMGLFVTAEILGTSLDEAFVLPRIAVQSDNTVYVVDAENILHQVPVTIVASVPRGIVISDGISAGDRIVVSRLGAAEVGKEVLPLKPGETPPPLKKKQDEETSSEDGSSAKTSESAKGSGSNTSAGEK